MTDQEAIKWTEARMRSGKTHDEVWEAGDMVIKALEAQVKLKECIANLDNPEFTHLTWSHEELLKLLKEHVA